MKFFSFLSLILCLGMSTTSMFGQNEVPLIDREIFFGNSEISGGQLSPTGTHIAFLKQHNGIMNIYVKTFDQKFEDAKLLTNSKSPILGFFWTYDSKYILYVNDNDGDENMNVFSVDPLAKVAENDEVPMSKNLTPLKDVTAQIYSVSKKNPDVMMIGLNDRDKAWHDLYKLEISTGKLTKEFENNDRLTGWNFDWDENARIAYRSDESGNSQMLRVEKDGKFEQIYETNLKESAYIAGWNKDNTKCYLVTNKGDIDKSTLFLMDPKDGSLEKIESDPENKVDFGGLSINRNTREIISTSYTLDKTKVYFRDKAMEADYVWLKAKFPGREIDFSSSTLDYNKMLIAVWGDKYATEVYFFNRSKRELVLQYVPKPKLKEVEQYLVEMRPITYKSSDGMEIPAYLTLPYGSNGKNLPLVIDVHGGPKGPRDYWGYNSNVQFLANRGYAVLQPNFRASGGYGKAFLNAGDKQWGQLMQDDITWGMKHLVNEGIVDKNRVAIMGGSYGGYATLAGLAFTPDLYTCGVDIVGPSNLFTLLESIPPYWEAGRKWLYEMTGDPETEEGKALLTKTSPLFHADKIVKPLLIVQGANDPRVKKAEADQIVVAMREKKKEVRYLLANDEGHGFRKPVNRKAMNAAIEKFFADHLGGRYQKEMTDEVAKKLEELEIDINTVELAKASDAKVLDTYPMVKSLVKSGTHNYNAVLTMQGNDIPMDMTKTIEEKDGKFIVTDKSKTPQGDVIDKAIYDSNWKIEKREIQQGGMTIPLEYSDKEAFLNMMGKTMNIAADGLMLCDGPGLDHVLAGMQLEKNIETAYFVVDLMSGKSKKMIAKFVGEEAIDGKNLNKIEIVGADNPNDKTTLWINPATHIAEKMVSVIPAYNNAVMTITKK